MTGLDASAASTRARLISTLPRLAAVVATAEVLWIPVFYLFQLPFRVEQERAFGPSAYDWAVLWLPVPVWLSAVASLVPLWRGHASGGGIVARIQRVALVSLVLTHAAVFTTTIRNAIVGPIAPCVSGCSAIEDSAFYVAPIVGSVVLSAGAVAVLRRKRSDVDRRPSGRLRVSPLRVVWIIVLSAAGLYFLAASSLWWFEGASNVAEGGASYRVQAVVFVAFGLLTPAATAITAFVVRRRRGGLYGPWQSAMVCALVVGFVMTAFRAMAGGGF